MHNHLCTVLRLYYIIIFIKSSRRRIWIRMYVYVFVYGAVLTKWLKLFSICSQSIHFMIDHHLFICTLSFMTDTFMNILRGGHRPLTFYIRLI